MRAISYRLIAALDSLTLAWILVAQVVASGATASANAAFERTWARTDKSVSEMRVPRTWIWGPSANSGVVKEEYAESHSGLREVRYFDKARMEISQRYATDDGLWYVTTVLPATELVTGQLQPCDDLFERAMRPVPSRPTVAGLSGIEVSISSSQRCGRTMLRLPAGLGSSTTPPATGAVGIMGSSVPDGVIAWGRWSTSGDWTETRPAYLHQVLPNAPEPDSETSDPSSTSFSETGHYLGSEFRDFWEASIGLPVFGYPLTEEYIETNAGVGAVYSVQFTERKCSEWHPENAGTPYQVLLDRLGTRQEADLCLLDDEPFRYIGGDEGPDARCLYFREAGHYVCDSFVFFWRDHGVEMGDPGISYRESLALFGFLPGEPFMTTNSDGDTAWPHYFKRAVFEFHPENVFPFRVLGAEVIGQRGW